MPVRGLSQLARGTDAGQLLPTPTTPADIRPAAWQRWTGSSPQRLRVRSLGPAVTSLSALGQALSGDLDLRASPAPLQASWPGRVQPSRVSQQPPAAAACPLAFPCASSSSCLPAPMPRSLGGATADWSSRLAEIAHGLEDSVGMPMPPALDAFDARLRQDPPAEDLAKALEGPERLYADRRRPDADMAQRVAAGPRRGLAKISEIESALLRWIEQLGRHARALGTSWSARHRGHARRVADEVRAGEGA